MAERRRGSVRFLSLVEMGELAMHWPVMWKDWRENKLEKDVKTYYAKSKKLGLSLADLYKQIGWMHTGEAEQPFGRFVWWRWGN